jgi:hypothetical protein
MSIILLFVTTWESRGKIESHVCVVNSMSETTKLWSRFANRSNAKIAILGHDGNEYTHTMKNTFGCPVKEINADLLADGERLARERLQM